MTVAVEPEALEAPLLPAGPQRLWLHSVGVLGTLAALASLALLVAGASAALRPLARPGVPGQTELAEAPPLFWISAGSYRDAGLQHGLMARSRIRGWLATREMQSYVKYAMGRGRRTFERIKADSATALPMYADELQGIAEGAGISIDEAWCLNLINELANMMSIDGASPKRSGRRCSDIYAVSPGGFADGFALGHNDDWGDDVRPYWYFFAYSVADSAQSEPLDFAGCAGLIYPGSLVGWAPTWNRHGIFSTQNTLTPRRQRQGGLASAFAQRRAICPSRSLAHAVAALASRGWSDAASVNLADLRGARMANVEVWEDIYSVKDVTAATGNYSHFNEFKHMSLPSGGPIDNPSEFRDDPRQARVDALPPPQSAGDVASRLSDPSVFVRSATIATLILNASTHELSVWCGVPSASAAPAYTWHLPSFFTGSA